MRRALVLLACLASSNAFAAGSAVGLSCGLNISGKFQTWNLSLDFAQGKYAARIGDNVVKRNEFSIDRVFGADMQSRAQSITLLFAESPMNTLLIINTTTLVAQVAPLSRTNPISVGVCSEAPFTGL